MLSPELIAEVGQAVRSDLPIASLRQRYPELHFTECSEDDVSPRYRPALAAGAHDLYLVTGASGHCLALTNDSALATGLLIAAKVDDDDA